MPLSSSASDESFTSSSYSSSISARTSIGYNTCGNDRISCSSCKEDIDINDIVVKNLQHVFHYRCAAGKPFMKNDLTNLHGFENLSPEDQVKLIESSLSKPFNECSSDSFDEVEEECDDDDDYAFGYAELMDESERKADNSAEEAQSSENFSILSYKDIKLSYYANSNETSCDLCFEPFHANCFTAEMFGKQYHFLCMITRAGRLIGNAHEMIGFENLEDEDVDMILLNLANNTRNENMPSPAAASTSAVALSTSTSSYSSNNKVKAPFSRSESERSEWKKNVVFLRDVDGKLTGNPDYKWSLKGPGVSNYFSLNDDSHVDPESLLCNVALVQRTSKGDPYSIILTLFDFKWKINMYFKMQLLRNKNVDRFYVFKSWGTFGNNRGGTFTDFFEYLDPAISEFECTFEEMTANKWCDRKFFKQKPGYMSLVDVEDISKESVIVSPDSKVMMSGPVIGLPSAVKNILKKIFNSDNISDLLDEAKVNFGMESDLMNRFSARHLARARCIIRKIKEITDRLGFWVDEEKKDAELAEASVELSNEFYSLIPYNGEFELVTKEGVCEKLNKLLDVMMDIRIVTNIMEEFRKRGENAGLDVLEAQYAQLHMRMEVVNKYSDEYQRIKTYLENSNSQRSGLVILDLIRVERSSETANFLSNYKNRMLLWHGTSWANYPSILTQGLRIKPHEAARLNGSSLGDGIYFADMAAKSQYYSFSQNDMSFSTSNQNNDRITGMLLLCDVALGEIATSSGRQRAFGYNSVRAGDSGLDPAGNFAHPDGYIIPLGKPRGTSSSQTEYCVFDVNQIRIKYLVHVQLKEMAV